MADKPRHRSGYSREEFEQVEMVCLTVIAALGTYRDELCVVGGLVPALLIDHDAEPVGEVEGDGHPGTNDFDVALALGLLDEGRYAELSAQLRKEGFGPDENEAGQVVRQRWRLGDLKATIDFLIAPTPGNEKGGRLQNLESDFAAMVTPGLGLAFEERIEVGLDGVNIRGQRLKRAIPVCGPGAFVVLKALAFHHRMQPKDAFDLVYVVERFPGGAAAVAERLVEHNLREPETVSAALATLNTDFSSIDSIGPQQAAEFGIEVDEDQDAAAADALGYVDDLLRECRERGLS